MKHISSTTATCPLTRAKAIDTNRGHRTQTTGCTMQHNHMVVRRVSAIAMPISRHRLRDRDRSILSALRGGLAEVPFTEREKQGSFSRSLQGCNACVARAYRDVRPGLARSTDCAAQWIHSGPKYAVRPVQCMNSLSSRSVLARG
jgi:hypothetical protein